MIHRSRLTRALVLGGSLGLLTAISHAEPAPAQPLQPIPEPQIVRLPANCLQETGSRLKPADGCINANGRSYDVDQLRSTGQPGLGSALRMLDPAVR